MDGLQWNIEFNHSDLIKTYEAKLKSFGVPVEELGFKPLQSTLAGQTLG